MYHLSKLPNGITLITVPVAGTKATTVLAMFPIGSRYETKDISGAAHFVEHLMFKGTAKRPTTVDISRDLEATGADYNAFTNKDYTGYYVKIDAAKQELAFDLVSDMLYNSKLDPAEVDKERGAIVEELRMYRDNPTMKVDMLFDQILFGNTPLGWEIGGTDKTVRGVPRAALWNFYRSHYSPKNMVLSVAGKIDPRLKKYLEYFSAGRASRQAKPPSFYHQHYRLQHWRQKPRPLSARVLVEEKSADQAHLILGFPGFKNNHPERYALSLLISILGVGMTSRLFVEVREKRGLAYMVRAGATSYRDVGAVYVQAGLDPARLSEAVRVIMAELHRISHEPVTAEELKNAKSSIAGRLALGLEDSSAQAEWYAKQFLFAPKIETPEEMIRQLNLVKASALTAVARALFRPEQMRLALIGKASKQKVMALLAND